MVKTGNNNKLLDPGECGVSYHSQVLGHPYQNSSNPICQASSYRSDDHKKQEGAYQSCKKRGYQKPYHLRHLSFKENIQLCRDNTDEQSYYNAALESDQFYRKSENMKGCHFHCTLRRRTGVCQTVGQHDTADHNTHNGPPAKSLHRTVSHTQRQESEDCSGGNIDQP